MEKIGPHQVLDEIGKGGMATVYRALQPSVNRVVALKVFPSNLETDEALVKRFKQEAETSANLIHDNIIKVWDASVTKPPYYIAMEFLDGGTLADRLVNGALPVEEAVAITGRLCDALDYAHSRGVIHRDLKPENILFSANNKPVLTDFGIAKAVEYSNLTVAGAKFGTPDYMSPEQAKGIEVDYRTDLYSLATVLHEMLTGRPPFRNDEPLTTMRQIIEDPAPSLRDSNPEITAEVETVIIRALAKNPEERYQSGMEFNQALLNALQTREVAASSSFETSMETVAKKDYFTVVSRAGKHLFSEPETRRKILLLGLLLIVLIACGIVIHAINNESSNPVNTRTTMYDSETKPLSASGDLNFVGKTIAPTPTEVPQNIITKATMKAPNPTKVSEAELEAKLRAEVENKLKADAKLKAMEEAKLKEEAEAKCKVGVVVMPTQTIRQEGQ